ncbi:MAG: bifunctional proline dehydrogenase/L-glutamate gamma-semialdehyde dehydrogenase PutA [Thalassovita sp.]
MPDISGFPPMDKRRDETVVLHELVALADLSATRRAAIVTQGSELVRQLRDEAEPGMMEVFLAEYGLSTEEGVALMCLAEALLRVPDTETIDALIEDKIAPSDWSEHLGQSASPLVNASTWGLLLTGQVLQADATGLVGTLKRVVKRMGEPVIRTAVVRAMREMGRQFVLGQDIQAAMQRAQGQEAKGYSYSYDMLGEAAMTSDDADRYAAAYGAAIDAIATACQGTDVRRNPGISVKLSALHPRYEEAQSERVMAELVPVVAALARRAARAGMGFNIDAEEADRLALSLQVIEAVLADPALAEWHGFGVVVQAYGRRAVPVLDGLYQLASRLDRRIMVRLVKGAYWDTEIKHAQVQGLEAFPVFTHKAATDVSYIACARKLLGMTDRIYPQFATHNAHTVAAVLDMGRDLAAESFEFQRLHGMGEALHDLVLKAHGTGCRIYAPVGAHRDLLAYLVRRLLENGANSSFVNQILDTDLPPEVVAACPFEALQAHDGHRIATGTELFNPDRRNSIGFDLNDRADLERIAQAMPVQNLYHAAPLIHGQSETAERIDVINPVTGALIGHVREASAQDAQTALAAAKPWMVSGEERAAILHRAADLYEQEFGMLFQLLTAEAGKTLADAVGELREAVDFLRYYAVQSATLQAPARGVFTCISPWNFPLAIFSGQVAAALAAGNGVLAKPAEATSLIAHVAVQLLHKAGVPTEVLQLLPGQGRVIGQALAADPRVSGVAFTGSTATAKLLQASMAQSSEPGAPLIAETGGLNAMIVDSTALPEQAVRDIVVSAFQSAGQRCSALRCLYVQEDIAPSLEQMLIGAMEELQIGDPALLSTDVGPVINAQARAGIDQHIARARVEGRLVHQLAAPTTGHFVGPALIRLQSIADLKAEVFGPVLHIVTFAADEIDKVITAVNATGYGLTFGLHSRIDGRVQHVADRVAAGNIYVNRNQIGAIVGSQPFGGEGLSGTGPKAGGPLYLPRFSKTPAARFDDSDPQVHCSLMQLEQMMLNAPAAAVLPSEVLPGPTGELNRLSRHARPPLLCLGPGPEARRQQVSEVQALGGVAVAVEGALGPDVLRVVSDIAGVVWWGDRETARRLATALCARDRALVPVITDHLDRAHAVHERHLCVDTTAAGGNAGLLAGQA